MAEDTANILIIGGQQIAPDSDGEYPLTYDLLCAADLTSIPAGSKIQVSYPCLTGRTPDHAVLVSMIEVLSKERILVFADFFRCPCCWEHALSFKSYTEAVMQLFAHEEATSIYFSIRGMGSHDDLGPFHEIAVEVDNGKFTVIEESVKNIVLRTLKPVEELCEAFDKQYREKFGE
jgi:hypothetical protein